MEIDIMEIDIMKIDIMEILECAKCNEINLETNLEQKHNMYFKVTNKPKSNRCLRYDTIWHSALYVIPYKLQCMQYSKICTLSIPKNSTNIFTVL